jgi:hypothetical protein
METFVFRAVALFLRTGPAPFRGEVVDVRRCIGVFLIFIVVVDPPTSGGSLPIFVWTILFFFGTD